MQLTQSGGTGSVPGLRAATVVGVGGRWKIILKPESVFCLFYVFSA